MGSINYHRQKEANRLPDFAVRTGLDLRSLMRRSRITLTPRGTGERHVRTKKEANRLPDFAVRTGLEPVTPCVTGMYSNQLN